MGRHTWAWGGSMDLVCPFQTDTGPASAPLSLSRPEKSPPPSMVPPLSAPRSPRLCRRAPGPTCSTPLCSRGSPQRACSPGQEAPRRCSRFVHQESPVLPGAAISMSQPMHTVLFVAHWVILCGLLCRRRGSVVVGDDGLQTQGSLEGLRIFWKK